jgi:type I restriction enzyme S subunit
MLNAERAAGGEMRPYLRNINVRWDGFDLSDVAEMDFPAAERSKYLLRSGDLMICEGGAGVGRAAVWTEEVIECYFQKSLHRVRATSAWPVEWLLEWLRVSKWLNAFVVEGNIATIPHLTAEQLRVQRLPMPQPQVCRDLLIKLRDRRRDIESTRSRLRTQIDLLVEHRQALITAAVTGELEIPGVAA